MSGREAIEYICWLAKADKLYSVALLTFDFELVTMVAQYTQKDPKEYLPYLASLKEMSANQMRFKVNLDMKQFMPALDALTSEPLTPDTHKTALDLIFREKLFEEAILLFSKKEGLVSFVLDIKRQYADYLFKIVKNTKAAAYLYENCGDFTKAL